MSTPYLLIKYHNSALAHKTTAIPVAFRAKGRYNSGNIETGEGYDRLFSYTLDADAIRAISSIGLAHLGDAVYELLVRTYLCAHGKATGKGLHRATVELVRAPKQAELADAIFGELTDEEHDVFRRGRNANVQTIPHSADRAQYQKATALEALFGWLYLQGRHERINGLFNRMMEANDAA